MHLRYPLLFWLAICLAHALQAQDLRYSASQIPDSLRKDAKQVVREHSERVEIISPDKLIHTLSRAVTYLDAKEAEEGIVLHSSYDDRFRIKKIAAYVYDAQGKLLKTYKEKDFRDVSSHEGLYTDSRHKFARISSTSVPFTILFEEQQEWLTTLAIPSFHPLTDERLSLQQASFELVAPAELLPRYRNLHTDIQPQKETVKEKTLLRWQLNNLPAMKVERFSPAWALPFPMVQLAPNQFGLSGKHGSMASWKDLGTFFYQLNADRWQLPEQVAAKVHALTDALPTRRQKTEALYHFLQETTRYISVQIGAGGWITFPASYVAQNGYGDCKALSNYMVSLLGEAGIIGHYTLIEAGIGRGHSAHAEFPVMDFNHAIVCVPDGADTLWLECTSQQQPFNFLGDFTSDRNALIVTEAGGKLVRTPACTPQQNRYVHQAQVQLNADGSGTLQAEAHYAGEQFDGVQGWSLQDPKDQQQRLLSKYDRLIGAQMTALSFEKPAAMPANPEMGYKAQLSFRQYGNRSGNRLLICPNICSDWYTLPKQENRKLPVITYHTDFEDVDETTFFLPEGYACEGIPEAVSLKTPFGEYEAQWKLQDGKLQYRRRFLLRKGVHPATAYSALAEFYAQMAKYDKLRVGLQKQQ